MLTTLLNNENKNAIHCKVPLTRPGLLWRARLDRCLLLLSAVCSASDTALHSATRSSPDTPSLLQLLLMSGPRGPERRGNPAEQQSGNLPVASQVSWHYCHWATCAFSWLRLALLWRKALPERVWGAIFRVKLSFEYVLVSKKHISQGALPTCIHYPHWPAPCCWEDSLAHVK